ncbi:hypothetical protein BGX27_000792 [Mortierella sp. AM989]|nr:hypothetical protein BGX27_000792 [Mortierella sp. AM989]
MPAVTVTPQTAEENEQRLEPQDGNERAGASQKCPPSPKKRPAGIMQKAFKKRKRFITNEVSTSMTNKTTRSFDLPSCKEGFVTADWFPFSRSGRSVEKTLSSYSVDRDSVSSIPNPDPTPSSQAHEPEQGNISLIFSPTAELPAFDQERFNLGLSDENTVLEDVCGCNMSQSCYVPTKKFPLPRPIPTESLDSPSAIFTGINLKNLLPGNDNEAEEGEHSDDEVDDDNNVLFPDATGQEFRFSATLDGVDVASGFQQLFNVVRKNKVYIKNTDEALVRSGVILLEKEGTKPQKQYLGEETLAQMREKALAKWHDNDVTASRNQVRAWLDPHEDRGYDRGKSRKLISENMPSDGKHQKLWAYLVNAIEEFPEFDSSKDYSESTAISSFILPMCRVYMSMPDKRVVLNFIDSTTASGRSRSGSRSRKEPDLALEIKDRANKNL